MADIGFIGLGHMGLPMATNLIKAGHTVFGYDIQEAAKTAFSKVGGRIAKSLIDIAQNQSIIITMLQTGPQVKNVCYGEEGFYQYALPQTLHIDCSTIDVHTAIEIQEKAKVFHLHAVDAPVSGGVNGAVAGTLTFMLGGDSEAYLKAQPILESMGKQIIHTGKAGSGQAAKICNNMILGISMIAVAESFIMAEKLGLSPQKLHEVVSHASGQCWVMDKYVPVPNVLENVPANHAYQPGFSLAMMLKDLKLSQKAAEHTGLKTPLAHLATQLFQDATEAGLSDLDFSVIIQQIKNLN